MIFVTTGFQFLSFFFLLFNPSVGEYLTPEETEEMIVEHGGYRVIIPYVLIHHASEIASGVRKKCTHALVGKNYGPKKMHDIIQAQIPVLSICLLEFPLIQGCNWEFAVPYASYIVSAQGQELWIHSYQKREKTRENGKLCSCFGGVSIDRFALAIMTGNHYSD